MVAPVAALDHDHSVTAMVAVPTAIMLMHAVFGASAVGAVMVMMPALDHHGLCACQRWPRNDEHTQSCSHITKLFHEVLLQTNAHLTAPACERSGGTGGEF
ncbi:hypothetical protein ASG57_19275 [Bradyrhizobium sp. Leaf396]|nr:hypothetical protein ASG57_19275 [Bradyrhizobium sp. Leaf396]